MLANFSALAESEPELLAYHFSQAGLFDLACTYRERAGDRAVARSSFTEAVAHFTAALADAAQGAEGPDRMRRELGLLLKSGPALTAIKGYHSPEVGEVYQRAHDHSVALGDEPGLFKATWGLWINAVAGRRLDLARDRAEALVLLAGKSGDDDLLLEGLHCRWSTGVFRGEPATIDENSREGIKRYDREKHSWMGAVFGGHDPGVCAYTAGAIGLSLRGRYPEARDLVEKAISLAKELKHPNSLAHAWMNGSLVAHLAGDHPTVNRHLQQLAELADKYNLPPPRAHAVFLSGWELAFGEDLGAGTAVMEAEFARASALSPFFRYYAALLAQAREKVGRVADALTVLQGAIDTIAEPGVGLYISELYRLQGICLLQDGASNADEAIRSLQTAVGIARQQRVTLLELRAAVSVAEATLKLGRTAPDLQPLRAVFADLRPGFESPDLDEAKRLLAA
jgi:predicted ATPase